MFLSSETFAGSRGFTVVLIGIGDTDFFNSQTYLAFRDGEPPRLTISQQCWNERATGGGSIDKYARIDIPVGLSKEVANAIWNGDKKAMMFAQKILRKGNKFSGSRGYDGMYILDVKNGKISLLGFGAREKIGPKNPSGKISIEWNQTAPFETATNLDHAFCKVSKPLDYGFSP